MHTPSRRYIKLQLEYDGTCYEGWQSQKSGNTIQDIIVKAIRSITPEELRLTGASRTDAGVHALGQVAVFGTISTLPANVFKRALNAILPADIRVLSAEETNEEFHPRFHAEKKRYFYLISLNRDESAFFQRYVCHVRAELDSDSMRQAASELLGRHDFTSFRASGCSAKTTIRTVNAIDVARLEEIEFMTVPFRGDFIKISIEADAFLRHMVRNIAGTLIEIGRGKMDAGSIKDLIAACDRTKAGPTAPAQGLFLEKVYY